MGTADIVDEDDFDLSRLHHVHFTPYPPQKCARNKTRNLIQIEIYLFFKNNLFFSKKKGDTFKLKQFNLLNRQRPAK